MTLASDNPTLIIVGAIKGVWSFSYTSYWNDIVSKYFNIERYEENKTYEKDTTFLVMARSYLDPDIREAFKDKKVIVDLTVEGKYASWGEVFDNKEPHHIVLYGSYSENEEPGAVFCPNFFWYNTSLASMANRYHRYKPNRNYSKKFLMPIGGKRAWRDHVVEILEPFLDDAYWSYFRRNRALPGDQPAKRADVLFQNPMWYDDTCFSLVLESITTQKITHESPIFLTEKIFKPISGQQPFMVVSAAGTLKFLSSQGFETYDNIFNEQYDVETDFDKKMNIIVENIIAYEKVPHDNVTLQKIAHNFNRFYDVETIRSGFEKEIVEPIYEYMSNSLIYNSRNFMISNPYTEEYYKSNNYTNYLSKKERYLRTADEIYQVFNKFSILNKDSTVLDYGCSLGFLIDGFKKIGIDNVYGYDISTWAIEQAKKSQCKILSTLEGDFNLGIFLDVLEHMTDEDIHEVFSNIKFDAVLVRIPCSVEENPTEFYLEVSRADATHINCKTANQWIDFFNKLGYTKNLYLNMSTIYNSDGCLCCLFF